MPILIQMIPTSWKKEFETQLRSRGAVKSYETLAQQLVNVGDEERHAENRRSPNDMDIDAADRAWAAKSGRRTGLRTTTRTSTPRRT